MKFELTPEIIDEVIFAMENQQEGYFFDTELCKTVPGAEIGDENDSETEIGGDRYIGIPEWDSFKGFQLMERFVGSLHNPVYREALRNALAGGRGVFRNFKNVLREKKEIERLWFSFKDREMRREVFDWYNSYLELLGIGDMDIDLEDVEETEDLVATDFLFDAEISSVRDEIEFIDKRSFYNLFPRKDTGRVARLYRERRNSVPGIESSLSNVLAAKTLDGILAGFIWGVPAEPGTVKIIQLYILPEYRGLGLGKVLLEKFTDEMKIRGIKGLEIELLGSGMQLQHYLEQLGFDMFSAGYSFKLE